MVVVVKELPAFVQLSPNVERITKNDAAENKFLVLFLMICFFPAVVLLETTFSSMTTLTHLSLRGLSPPQQPESRCPRFAGTSRGHHKDIARKAKTSDTIGTIFYLTVTLIVAAI
jgi:hypothetical protein